LKLNNGAIDLAVSGSRNELDHPIEGLKDCDRIGTCLSSELKSQLFQPSVCKHLDIGCKSVNVEVDTRPSFPEQLSFESPGNQISNYLMLMQLCNLFIILVEFFSLEIAS
jgi:hypothetical protein